MKRSFRDHRWVYCLVTALLAATAAFAQNNKIETSTPATAGGTASSTSFKLTAIIGQPSPVGGSSAGQFALSSGFVFTLNNNPPAVANAISAQTLALGGAAFTRDLNASPTVFTDTDGDVLTYTTNSSNSAIATASIAGSLLTVAPVAVGSATITITADDKNGNTVSTTFTVTVNTAPNRVPTVANAIPNQNLKVGETPFMRDLNTAPTVFNDPDGDPLSYTASSNNNSIATATLSSNTLMIAPLAAGTAMVTVTANDNKGGTVSTTFTVTVTQSNRPPTVANTIPNQTLQVGGSTWMRDLNASPPVFTDPDGDALIYMASSSGTNIATASVSGSTLIVTPVTIGNVTITLTADDGKGAMTSTMFTVTVGTAPNRAPTVANTIGNQTLNVGGAAFSRNLNIAPAVFNDPDGDALTYITSSSAPNFATATIAVSVLTVTPVAAGNATITVTANDNRGGTISTTFNVTVMANQSPNISLLPVTEPQSVGPINIQADITDDRPNITVQLQYRRSGDLTSTSITMNLVSGNRYQANIPDAAVSSRGVEYAILATDADSAQTRLPADTKKFFSISIAVVSENKPSAQPGGSAAASYRLISVPFQLTDASALAVLQDDLGSYNNTAWRLFGLDAGQPLTNKSPYVEISQNGSFVPGKSFFLIVNTSKTVDAGPGQTLKTEQPYSIALLPGHNFIASPFNFSIPISKLRLQSGAAFSLQTYAGAWTPVTDVISPWEGYYLPNNGGNDNLLVDPNLTASAQPRMAEVGWRLQIRATCGEARDLYNFAGVAPASADDWDDLDVPEPPPIGDFVSVYFPHPEWQKLFQHYTNDIQSVKSTNHRWNFSVATGLAHETVSLKFDGVQNVAPELSVFLIDTELNYKQNLRENAAYSYQPRHLDRPKEFTLIVGQDEFIDAQTASAQGVPASFVLEQNFPNPFSVRGESGNSITAIRFGLPQASAVTIKIFDLAGHEVATLLDRAELPAGRHQRVWDGRDTQGRAVASGIYFCRFMTGNLARTIKLMVMR